MQLWERVAFSWDIWLLDVSIRAKWIWKGLQPIKTVCFCCWVLDLHYQLCLQKHMLLTQDVDCRADSFWRDFFSSLAAFLAEQASQFDLYQLHYWYGHAHLSEYSESKHVVGTHDYYFLLNLFHYHTATDLNIQLGRTVGLSILESSKALFCCVVSPGLMQIGLTATYFLRSTEFVIYNLAVWVKFASSHVECFTSILSFCLNMERLTDCCSACIKPWSASENWTCTASCLSTPSHPSKRSSWWERNKRREVSDLQCCKGDKAVKNRLSPCPFEGEPHWLGLQSCHGDDCTYRPETRDKTIVHEWLK